MTVKPILFNTDMVRAILDGRKTMTRRVINPQPDCVKHFRIDGDKCVFACGNLAGVWLDVRRLPYRPGDTLYVRETWKYYEKRVGSGEDCYTQKIIAYKADELRETKKCSEWYEGKWHPSIHMPREAARIWLRVTDVRIEHLNDMTVDDAIKEGVNTSGIVTNQGIIEYRVWNRMQELWDSTIKKKDLPIYGWDANPWVWVIEFERAEKPDK